MKNLQCCCMKLSFSTSRGELSKVFPHSLSLSLSRSPWRNTMFDAFPLIKPPFIDSFRGDHHPFPSISMSFPTLPSPTKTRTELRFPWASSPYFSMVFPAFLDGFSQGFPRFGGHEVAVIQQLPRHEARRLRRALQRAEQHGRMAAQRRGAVPWEAGGEVITVINGIL